MIEGVVLVPALIMGIIIGFIELVFVHSDEVGMGWFHHGMHALPFAMIFVFISMNISYVYGLINLEYTAMWQVDLIVRAFIAVIAMFKVAGAAAVVGKVGEKWYHTLILGALIMAAPYIWDFIGPFITPYLPAVLQ